jgi:hypothetical protein
MRLLAILLIISSALAAALSPLPGVSALPDGTDVVIVSGDAQAKLAKGTVKLRVLTMTALHDKLTPLEMVDLWVGVQSKTTSEIKSFSGTVSKDGSDVILEIAGNKVSFTQTLKEAYGVKLDWKK